MRKFFTVFLLAGIICFLSSVDIFAQEEDAAAVAEELSSELQSEGVPEADVQGIQKPIKEMLKKGAGKKDIKNAVSDLSKNGVKGKDLKKSVDSMNDLVQDGESPEEAGNIVSKAAKEARAQGLKGRDLAAKVHEAIEQRKQERDAQKQQKKIEKQEQKQKRVKQQAQEQEQEQVQEQEQEQEGVAPATEAQGKGKGKGKGKSK